MKPRLNAQKRERLALLEREQDLLAALFHDDQERAAIDAGMGLPRAPMSVWVDSDRSWAETLLQPCELPPWEKLTERMKMFIGFDVAMEFGWAFSFTANISPDLVEKWDTNGCGFVGNIGQRLRRAMRDQNIADLPFCYVVEARTKSGKTRNKPHIHGVAICENPLDSTRLKVALESAFAYHLGGKKRRRAVEVKRSFAKEGEPMGRFRWVSYITKNVHLYDVRFGRRRIYMSQSFTQAARAAWAVRRGDPHPP